MKLNAKKVIGRLWVSDIRGGEKNKSRLHLLDEVRGLAVFCMIFYHAFYDLAVFFDLDSGRFLLEFFSPAEPFFAGLFILISGISSRLSRSNLKRGARLAAIALLLTTVTLLILPDAPIYFGILHCLSVCMLLFAVLKPIAEKLPAPLGMALCAAVWALTVGVGDGVIGIRGVLSVETPAALSGCTPLLFTGLCTELPVMSDYFPLLPWCAVFFFGAFLGEYAANDKFPDFFKKIHFPPLCLLGRNALLIYVVHQPVIYAVLTVIGALLSKMNLS